MELCSPIGLKSSTGFDDYFMEERGISIPKPKGLSVGQVLFWCFCVKIKGDILEIFEKDWGSLYVSINGDGFGWYVFGWEPSV